MALIDYRHYPYLQELQQWYDNENEQNIKDFVVGNFLFSLPENFANKLERAGINQKSNHYQLQKYYDSNARQVSDNPMDFWELTPLELELVGFMIDVLKTKTVVDDLNKRYNKIFTTDYLAKKFKFSTESPLSIYYAKVSDTPQPDDKLCIAIPKLEVAKLLQIADQISEPHAHGCICIVHKQSLEIYGVFDEIAEHIKNLK